MKRLKKLSLVMLACMLIAIVNPIGASASWKQNNDGWWYTVDNSYATGWKEIDGKWYYFNSNGYMAHDTTIDGYSLNSSGAWTNSIITLDQAKQIALNKVKTVKYPNSNVNVVIVPYFDINEEAIEGRNGYIVTVGEDNSQHTTPTARVFVDKHTSEVFDAFDVVMGIGDKKLKEFK